MIDLKDKIVVVTGGNGLLGNAFIQEINKHGGIAISADINAEKNLGEKQYYCDITDESSVQELLDAVVKEYGKIDGWVNNAYPRTKDWGAKVEDLPLSSWKQNLDMHLTGYFICSRIALEQMKIQKFGSLINLGSIYGVQGPDFTVYDGTAIGNPVGYAAIKGGIINLTRYFASYYGKYNVRANCVSPGGIFDNQDEIFVKNYEHKVPMKRMGLPADIAPSVVFLLADGSKYITGHNLIVDGGWSAV
jgi:NAD(P)-dependent dehydrogenase (short-subunit alcohol dehydrogenase family)